MVRIDIAGKFLVLPIRQKKAGWPALLDAVELRGDELLGVDWVFGDCQPKGMGEIIEVVEGLLSKLVCDVLGEWGCHVKVSFLK